MEADEPHIGKVGIGDHTVQPILAIRFNELVAVGLRQKRNAKLEADREYRDIGRNSLSARHDDCPAVITVECAANGFDPAVGHHRKEFRCCDRYRTIDSIFDPLFRYHSTLLQLQLQLEKTFERPPVRSYQRLGDGMGCARHGADAPTAEHFLLGADVENPFEIDEPSDEVRNSPHRLAIDQRDLARAGIDGIDRNIGCGLRATEADDLLSLDDGGIRVLRGMQNLAACRPEGVFAGMADRLGFIELAGADGYEVKFLASEVSI